MPTVLHGRRTSLTFDVDPETSAVLATRRGHAALPEPAVPKGQAGHLELGCGPVWLHNGLGGLRQGKGDRPHTMGTHVANMGTEGQRQFLNSQPDPI